MRREKNAQHIAEALAPQVELLRRKPSRPRGPVFVDGVVRWDPPKETRNVTHFNIYADDDKNLSARLSLGQTEHVLIADRVYISSYNERSGLESARVMAERTGEVTPGGVPESVAERLDDVTGLTGRYEYRDLKDGKGLRLALAIRANLPSPIYGMKGLQSYIENPDRSAGGAGIKADGSTKADGSAQAGGEWSPKPGPRRPYLANEEFIIDGLDPVKQQTKIRVYLATYGAKTENELVRANTTGATPSVVITVDPPADLPPSTKAAPLVKFFTVVENLGKVDSYGVNGAGQRALFPAMAWVIPVGVFGVALFVIRDGGRHQRLTHGLWYGDDYRAEILDFPYEDERVRFYALSANEQGQVNEYAPGVTPYVDTILAAPPVEEAGKEYTSRVVSFDVGDAVFWPPNSEGQEAWATFPVTAVLPRDPTFGAWSLWVIVPWQTEHIQVSGWESGTEIPVKIPYTPGATQSWTFYALSRDVNQRANTYVASGPFATPSETLLMSPPPLGSAGIEHTSLVSLLSGGASIQYRQTADGVEEWRLKLQWQPPNDDTFGQMKYSIERTSGTAEYVETEFAGDTGTVSYTKWRAFVVGEVYTAWFGSVSVNSRENSLVAGVTPRVTGLAPTLQTGGALKATGWPLGPFSQPRHSRQRSNRQRL